MQKIKILVYFSNAKLLKEKTYDSQNVLIILEN
jgi:hypothetical protein